MNRIAMVKIAVKYRHTAGVIPDTEYSPLLRALLQQGLVLEEQIGSIPQDDDTKQRIESYEPQEMTLIRTCISE